MAKRLTYYILAALVLGVVVGWALNTNIEGIRGLFLQWGWIGEDKAAPALLTQIAGYIAIVTAVFLNLIKMIIAPLVFATLVAGIAHMGDAGALGRIGFRAVGWFVCASLISLSLGLVLVNLLQPGVGLNLALPPASASAGVEQSAFNLSNFITHIFPKSGIDAMANNEILQIVIFSLFIGVAITAVGEKAKPLVRAVDALVDVMLQVTNYVMRFAPFAVFAAVTSVIAKEGLGIVVTFGRFIGSFYFGLVILWAILIGLGLPVHRQADEASWSATSAIRSCSLSPPPPRRPPIRARWRRSTSSACRARSPASCCRSAIRSTSTGRCST